jgi:hypothetical protein
VDERIEKMKNPEESEFGKGLVVNLVKFSEHLHHEGRLHQIMAVDRWIKNGIKEEGISSDSESINQFKRIELRVYNEPNKALAHLIEMWANGASDHLFDIQVPKGWRNLVVAKRIRELRDLGLKMGHGFTDTLWTADDIHKLQRLVEQISLAIDKKLGLKGDWGQW